LRLVIEISDKLNNHQTSDPVTVYTMSFTVA